MKITKEQLKKLIKEEMQTIAIEENYDLPSGTDSRFPHIIQYLQTDGDESILRGENAKFTLRFIQELTKAMRTK